MVFWYFGQCGLQQIPQFGMTERLRRHSVLSYSTSSLIPLPFPFVPPSRPTPDPRLLECVCHRRFGSGRAYVGPDLTFPLPQNAPALRLRPGGRPLSLPSPPLEQMLEPRYHIKIIKLYINMSHSNKKRWQNQRNIAFK